MKEEIVFENLKWSIQALALPADRQIKVFPDYVIVSDELLLEYDNWKTVVIANYQNKLTEQQIFLLERLEEMMEDFPENKASEINNFLVHPFFEDIRIVAQQALFEFKWNVEEPPLNRNIYIKR